MQSTRHTLCRSLITIAMLAALAACKQSAPLATNKDADAAAATAEATAATPATPVEAANAPLTPAPAADTASTVVKVMPVVADKAAKDAVMAAMGKLKALRSYRMTMLRSDGPTGRTGSTIDYAAPDRYRIETAGLPLQVVIGDTLYATSEGGTKATPLPAGDIASWRDPIGLFATGNDFTAEKGARRFVFGMPTTEYKLLVGKPVARNVNVLIGPMGLPVKLESESVIAGKAVVTMVRYSHFDSADIKIDAPK